MQVEEVVQVEEFVQLVQVEEVEEVVQDQTDTDNNSITNQIPLYFSANDDSNNIGLIITPKI